MIGALAAALALAAGDPCAPVEPLQVPEPAVGALYRKVGDAERAAGSRETAVIAYRSAAERDPADASSRAALRALCAAREGADLRDPFDDGLARMGAGDRRGAVASFQEARAAGPDPSAALLQGICLYQLGEDEGAVPPLREAEAAAAHRDAARFYLGLVALRRGEGGEAAALLDTVVQSPGLGPLAFDLARLARRDGHLVLSLLGESGWDSNATLAPSSLGGSGGGGLWSLAASGLYRPSGESGPYLRATARYHQQLELGALDLGAASGAAGWHLGSGGRALVAEYLYDTRVLDGSPFLSAHQLLASGWLSAGDLILRATWFVRFESYRSGYQPFSGTWQQAEARGSWVLAPATWLGLAYRVGTDAVQQSSLSWLEHGPRADFHAALGRRWRLGLEAAASFRPYREVDPLFGAKRADTYLDGSALLEYDLGVRWIARLSVDARKAFSNVPAFEYVRVVPTLGIAYVMGL